MQIIDRCDYLKVSKVHYTFQILRKERFGKFLFKVIPPFGIKDRLVVERRKVMCHLINPNIQSDFIPVN